MNKLVMTVAATMAFAAFAQDVAPSAVKGKLPSAPSERARSMRPPMMMGQGAIDPLMRAMMNPVVMEKIGLSDEQKAKLAALKNEQDSSRELQAKVRAGMDRQIELLKAEKIDEAAVMKVIDEVFEARKDIAKAQMKRTIAVRSLLTPEQVSKALEAMKAARGSNFRARGLKDRGPKVPSPEGAAPKCENGKCEPLPVK